MSLLANSFSHYAQKLYRGQKYKVDVQIKKHDVASPDIVIDMPLSPEEMTRAAKKFIKEFEKEIQFLPKDIKNMLNKDLKDIYRLKRKRDMRLIIGVLSLATAQIVYPEHVIDVNQPYNISSSFSHSSFAGMLTSCALGVFGGKLLNDAWDDCSDIKELNDIIETKQLHIQAPYMGSILLSQTETIYGDKDDNVFFNGKICSGHELMFLQDMCKHLYDNKEVEQDNNFRINILRQMFALKNEKIITKNDIIKIFANSVKESTVAIDRLKNSANKVLKDMEASSSGNIQTTS